MAYDKRGYLFTPAALIHPQFVTSSDPSSLLLSSDPSSLLISSDPNSLLLSSVARLIE